MSDTKNHIAHRQAHQMINQAFPVKTVQLWQKHIDDDGNDKEWHR